MKRGMRGMREHEILRGSTVSVSMKTASVGMLMASRSVLSESGQPCNRAHHGRNDHRTLNESDLEPTQRFRVSESELPTIDSALAGSRSI